MSKFRVGDRVVVKPSEEHGSYGISSEEFWDADFHVVQAIKGITDSLILEGRRFVVLEEMCSLYDDGVYENE